MQISAQELAYTYGQGSAVSFKALNGVDITINEGAFFGIIGKTGSGKSTFIQHLNGLIKVQKDSGKLVVGEFDLTDKKTNYKSLRAKVGMVFQYPEQQLFAETVYEDVAFGIKNFMPNKNADEVKEMVVKALSLVGINDPSIMGKSPFDLSGGQKRRVAIAGVIASRPEVLVLDEPVAGLDPIGKREFLALLKRLHQDFIKTIIIVSHDMNVISENCTSVAVFADGKVYSEGSPKQVFGSSDAINASLTDCTVASLVKGLSEVGVKIDCDFTVEDFTNAFSLFYKGVK